MSSWADRIRKAGGKKEEALLLLSRARGRGSKSSAENDIIHAVSTMGVHTDIWTLVDYYQSSFSLAGYAQIAEKLAEDIESGKDLSHLEKDEDSLF